MTDVVPSLSWANMLKASDVLEADRHYTVGVFGSTLKPAPAPEKVLADLETLSIHGFSHTSSDTGFWLIIEPEKDVVAGQLNVIGLSYGIILGVWDYRPASEGALDAKELLEGVGDTATFLAKYWLIIVGILFLFLILVIYLVMRYR